MLKHELVHRVLEDRYKFTPPLEPLEIASFVNSFEDKDFDDYPESRTWGQYFEEYQKIPLGLTKTQIKEEIKSVNKSIDFITNRKRAAPRLWFIHDYFMDEYLNKKKRLQSRLIEPVELGNVKDYPITTLIEFDRAGFAPCLWHVEKTGSLKYYPKDNRAHCFGACGKSFDVIDVFMKINNCDFKEAVKRLKG